jgi:hypothetical protein
MQLYMLAFSMPFNLKSVFSGMIFVVSPARRKKSYLSYPSYLAILTRSARMGFRAVGRVQHSDKFPKAPTRADPPCCRGHSPNARRVFNCLLRKHHTDNWAGTFSGWAWSCR